MRIVSLVPSHTETLVALGVGEELVGVTRYCSASGALSGLRPVVVGGTKDPDVESIVALRPDVVVACDEENRIEDVEELRRAGIHVEAISPRSVLEAAAGVARLGDVVARKAEASRIAESIHRALEELRREVAGSDAVPVFCPIWYRPWMTFSMETYCSSVLRTSGACNVFDTRNTSSAPGAPDGGNLSRNGPVARDRYFETSLEEAVAAGAVAALLPTEPFRFGERHRAMVEAILGPTVIVDGKALTWYGYRTPLGLLHAREAVRRLERALQAAL